MLRNRGTTKDSLNSVRQLDAFPKVPEEYTQTTRIGGTLSVISRALIVYLIYTEIIYYMDSKLVFKFRPDTDMDTKLKIHIDLTVAMPCKSIGADILDSTNQNIFSFGVLEEEDTWWEMCPNQKNYFEYMQHLNGYLREEYHSLAELLYKGDQKLTYTLPERTNKPTTPFDACRIHGSLTLNKVAGNFHITAGKSLHFPQGHIHISSMFEDVKYNFSHRINRFSFGDVTGGIVHPLEGDEKVLTQSSTMMQYFIEVVPTDVKTFMSTVKTFQYSVKENSRPIDHDQGSHGIPGLYFKYDVSALKVLVYQDRDNIIQFIVRLCSIIAGIIVISGRLNIILEAIIDFLLNLFSPQTLQMMKEHNKKLELIQRQNQQTNQYNQQNTKEILIKNDNLLLINANTAITTELSGLTTNTTTSSVVKIS